MTDDFYSKKQVAGKNKINPMKEPRFSEIATFMRAPLADSLEKVDIGLIVSKNSVNAASSFSLLGPDVISEA